MDDFNFDLIHVVSPSFPKKNFLALFSIPIISKPFFEKNKAHSNTYIDTMMIAASTLSHKTTMRTLDIS